MARFLDLLGHHISKLKQDFKLSDGKAFGMWLAMEYLGLDETEAFEAASIDGRNDKDIDLFFVDDESERVVIAQLKYHNKGSYKANKNEFLGLIHSVDWLKDEAACAREGRPELLSASKEFTSAISKDYSIEFIYAFCGPPHKETADAVRQFNAQSILRINVSQLQAHGFNNPSEHPRGGDQPVNPDPRIQNFTFQSFR